MRRWRIVGSIVGIAVLLVWGSTAARHPPRTPREAARALHAAGLTAMARLEGDPVLAAMRASWRADPTFLPAFVDGLKAFWSGETLLPGARSEIAGIARSAPSGLGLCAAAFLAAGEGASPPSTSADSNRTEEPCALVAVLLAPPHEHPPTERARAAEILRNLFPESPTILDWYLEALGALGAWERVARFADLASRDRASPMVRGVALAHRGAALHATARHEEAAEVEARAVAEGERAGPGVLMATLGSMHLNAAAYAGPDVIAHLDSAAIEKLGALRRIREGADPSTRLEVGLALGESLLGQGRLHESHQEWDRLLRLADSLGIPGWQAEARMRRGRTLVKSGRVAEAEAELLAARSLAAGSTLLRPAYETEHNLMHLYEADGRAAEALAAGRAFVELMRGSRAAPVRMISYHDVGWLLRRAGERAEGDSLLERMVALIDSLGDYSFYAGEYFELGGDLERAAAYYRRQSPASEDGVRASAALVRVSEALADTARAVALARDHDGRLLAINPEGHPLLPGVLARAGRTEEADSALEAARRVSRERGQSAAWARLTLEAAALHGGAGRHARAAALADSAKDVARSVGDGQTVLRAAATAALQRARSGPDAVPAALGEVRAVRAEALRMDVPTLASDMWFAEGEILALGGAADEADEAFQRAWFLADSVAGSLAQDIARAGFRAARSRITDGALALAASEGVDGDDRGRGRIDRWLAWSDRRRSAGPLTGASSVGDLRKSLGSGNAMIDYAVLPEAVWALVLTGQDARILRLPLPPDSLRTLVRDLIGGMAPRLGSQLDLGRARFDAARAHALYRGLVAPVEPYLEGRRRLVILPDGPLHLLPFDALVTTPAGEDVAYLIERYEVRVAAAPRVAPHSSTHPPLRVLAVAGPDGLGSEAASHRDEVERIRRVFGEDRSTVLAGGAATPAAMLSEVSRHAVVHVAAHAEPNPGDPDRAFLTLGGAGRPARLHAHDIGQADFGGTLVVLSGCDTGAGRLLAGEGVLSLGRVFLGVGADAVVATLWPIGTPTIPLVEGFHAALVQGMDAGAALRKAKLELIRRPGNAPVFWAPMVLLRAGI